MKAERQSETFDRTSTREELCEVIDLLCDDDAKKDAAARGRLRTVPEAAPESLSAELVYDSEDEADGASEADELSETLSDLFAPEELNWIN